MSILRVLAIAATVWLPVHTAWADDNPPPRTDCPSLNGTWKVRYVFDKMGAPIDITTIPPWPNLLVSARFDGSRAVLTWFNGKSEKFRLTKDYGKPGRVFEGISSGGYIISADIATSPPPDYPQDQCYLDMAEFYSDTKLKRHDFHSSLLLEKVP